MSINNNNNNNNNWFHSFNEFYRRKLQFIKKKTLIPCEENAFKKIHLQKKEKEN